jgi:hypothetical protein
MSEWRDSPAPTGHAVKAQGNALGMLTGHAVKAQGNALGMPPKIGQALKGRNIASAGFISTPPSSAPSGREFILTIAPRALPCSLPISPCQYEFVLLMSEGGVKHSSLEGAACPGPTMNSNMFLWATSA